MKPWEKLSQGNNYKQNFNEFYTTYEQCEEVLGSLKKLGFLDKFKKICCPCDGDQSNIVKWLQNNTNAEIVHFNYLDCNSQKARQIMLRCGCVITNPPFSMKCWKPLFLFLHNSQIPYFIWGPLCMSNVKYCYYLDFVYVVPSHKAIGWDYQCKNGLIKNAPTIFYTNFDVPYLDYEYVPTKKMQFYNEIPVYDKIKMIPKDYYGWMYVPITFIRYIKYYEINKKLSDECLPGKFIRVCVRRRKEDGDT